MAERGWWEERWFVALVIIASAIPLLLPETPPLVDVPGHMGRFRVQLDLANSPDLQRYFEFHWALVGNLGVDLLVIPLAPLFGLELAVKLIVLTIPPLTVAGILWVAKEIHGRIPPTTLFALPFVYSFPFNFGFINYSLSLALALCAFAYWLRLTRLARFRARALLFLPISLVLWITHAFGWAILGMLAFPAETMRLVDSGERLPRALSRAALSMVPLLGPLVVMLLWRSGINGGVTDLFFDFLFKAYALVSALRDRWLLLDCLGVAVALVVLGGALFDKRLEVSRLLVIPAAFVAVVFVLMPSRVLGLSYADMRLVPLFFIIALIAIRVNAGHREIERSIAWLAVAFFGLRLMVNTVSYSMADADNRATLSALKKIPPGSAVLTLVGEYCNERWQLQRYAHLGSFVIVRKHGFSNDQWQATGAQLLRVRYKQAGPFTDDRSSYAYSHRCLQKMARKEGELVYHFHRLPEKALEQFPRDAFDYVWMIDPGEFDMKARPGLTPIWREQRAVLYRVDH